MHAMVIDSQLTHFVDGTVYYLYAIKKLNRTHQKAKIKKKTAKYARVYKVDKKCFESLTILGFVFSTFLKCGVSSSSWVVRVIEQRAHYSLITFFLQPSAFNVFIMNDILHYYLVWSSHKHWIKYLMFYFMFRFDFMHVFFSKWSIYKQFILSLFLFHSSKLKTSSLLKSGVFLKLLFNISNTEYASVCCSCHQPQYSSTYKVFM